MRLQLEEINNISEADIEIGNSSHNRTTAARASLVQTSQAAHQTRFLFHQERMKEMGKMAREYVRQNFLLTRHLRDYLLLMLCLMRKTSEHRIFI